MKKTLKKATVKKGGTIKLLGQSGFIKLAKGSTVEVKQIGGWVKSFIPPKGGVNAQELLEDDTALVAEMHKGWQTFNWFYIKVNRLEMI
jgi:hypothetical protein